MDPDNIVTPKKIKQWPIFKLFSWHSWNFFQFFATIIRKQMEISVEPIAILISSFFYFLINSTDFMPELIPFQESRVFLYFHLLGHCEPSHWPPAPTPSPLMGNPGLGGTFYRWSKWWHFSSSSIIKTIYNGLISTKVLTDIWD